MVPQSPVKEPYAFHLTPSKPLPRRFGDAAELEVGSAGGWAASILAPASERGSGFGGLGLEGCNRVWGLEFRITRLLLGFKEWGLEKSVFRL